MKDKKFFLFVALLFVALLDVYTLLTVSKNIVVEYPLVIEREVETNNCACTPCIDEPQWEKCIFDGLIYESIVDNYDIFGNQQLKKGEVFTIRDKMFISENYHFCSESSCFEPDFIINKKYFKVINNK